MARVTGPAMSLDASGTIAGTLVFSKWKGRNYIRERVIPANPKSGGQVGVRSMFKFLAQIWDAQSAPDKASWEDRADDMIVSTFNAFMSYNQRRWRNFQMPSSADPAAETGTAPTGPTGVATPGVRSMTVVLTDGVNPPDFGYAIFRSLTGTFTLAWSNCVAVVEWGSGGTTTWIDTPLVPDQYFYNAIGFLDTGLAGADGTEFDGTIA
ncbi:MAG: DUF6266 family protein [Thermoguttaceae bacterium]